LTLLNAPATIPKGSADLASRGIGRFLFRGRRPEAEGAGDGEVHR